MGFDPSRISTQRVHFRTWAPPSLEPPAVPATAPRPSSLASLVLMASQQTPSPIGRQAVAGVLPKMKVLAKDIDRLASILTAIRSHPDTARLIATAAKAPSECSPKIFEEYGQEDTVYDPTWKGDYLIWFLQDVLAQAHYCYQLKKTDEGAQLLTLVHDGIRTCNTPFKITVGNMLAKIFLQLAFGPQGMLNLLKEFLPLSKGEETFPRIQAVDSRGCLDFLTNLPDLSCSDSYSLDHSLSRLAEGTFWLCPPRDFGFVDFLSSECGSLRPGTTVIIGDDQGGETRLVASHPGVSHVQVVDVSELACHRVRTLSQRLKGVLGEFASVETISGKIQSVSFSEEVNLVVAIQVLSFLNAGERTFFYEKIKSSLLPGGRVYLAVSLNEGDLYRQWDSTGVHQGVILLQNDLPNGDIATYAKKFFRRHELERELEKSGITASQGWQVKATVVNENIGVGNGISVNLRIVIERVR